MDLADATLTFRYDAGEGWRRIGEACDATTLSDEHAEVIADGQIRALGFTGALFGLWSWDLSGAGHPADFDDASYSARASSAACAGVPGPARLP